MNLNLEKSGWLPWDTFLDLNNHSGLQNGKDVKMSVSTQRLVHP